MLPSIMPGPRGPKTKMKTIYLTTISLAGLALLSSGCVERRVVYVPAYQAAPVVQTQPVYTYPPQTAAQPAPPTLNPAPQAVASSDTVPAAPTAAPAPAVTPPSPQPPMVVAQAPPPPQVEVVPVAPGPAYVWAPGYWSVGIGGGWVWVRGGWVVRPHPHAVWVGGHWTTHGHGYVWVGGHWR